MLVHFMRRDFLEEIVDDVLDKAGNCSENPHLVLLSIRLIHSKAHTKEEEKTSKLNISRVLECTGYLTPGETFQSCFDHILKIVSLGLINATMPPVPPTVDTGKELLPYIPAALLALLLIALLLAILVKKRRSMGVVIANGMRTIVW